MTSSLPGATDDDRFRAYVTATSDVVFSMSPDWREMRYMQGRGFLADTAQPDTSWWDKYIHPDDRTMVEAAVADAIEAKSPFELEHRILKADGTWGWAFSRAIPLFGRDGELVEWFGAARDVTRRKQAEQALHEARAESERQRRLYEAILGNTPDLAYVFDLRHRFIYANEGLLRMWGRTWEEAMGRNCLELGYEPWHAQMHDREIEQVVATKQPVRGEVPFTGTFGRRIYDYIFVPVLSPDGSVEAVAGTTRDVTEYREAQRRRDEFLAMLSHELRNPLAPLRNGLHLLRARAGDAAVAPIHDMMERQIAQLVRLVDDLLEVSRITRGALELRRETVHLAAVMHQALETSNPVVQAGGHRLTVTVPEAPLWMHADPVRLSQVLANLLCNAARYTPKGGAIEFEASREGDHAVIHVRDNGMGIAPDRLPKLFQMFSRGEGAEWQSPGGLGVGLALARTLVEMHGGTVEARSAGVGRGSDFVVTVPVAAAQPQPERIGPETDDIAGYRILVVDDNVDAADSIALVLSSSGASVRVAASGEEALEIHDAFRPDVVLLDIGMPGVDGYDVAREIRARTLSDGKAPVLIALTGWGQEQHRERAAEAGFAHHLVKPADIGRLKTLLAALKPGDRRAAAPESAGEHAPARAAAGRAAS